MHFPSAIPCTRLSSTTGSLPVPPSQQPRSAGSGFKAVNRGGKGAKGRFRDSLGGLSEEDGEDVIDIKHCSSSTQFGRSIWASLTREELCIWTCRPKVAIAKAKRTPASLRQHGSNASLAWIDSNLLVITTNAGQHLFFRLETASGRQGPTAYELPSSTKGKGKAAWSTGPGEARPLTAINILSAGERIMKVGDGVSCTCVASNSDQLLVGVMDPPSLRVLPLPSHSSSSSAATSADAEIAILSDWPWLHDNQDVTILEMIHVENDLFVFVFSDGKAYLVNHAPEEPPPLPESPTDTDKNVLFDQSKDSPWAFRGRYFHQQRGIVAAVNQRMRLVCIGNDDGTVHVYHLPRLRRPNEAPQLSHICDLKSALKSTSSLIQTGRVTSLAWTSDGYSLAVGWERGFSIWSVFGKLGAWTAQGFEGSGYTEGERGSSFEDHFLDGIRACFWSEGNTELFVLTPPPATPKGRAHDEQLFVLPFAKSAVTSLHSPDNTKHAFLQMDDRVLVYRGADQPDMSVINPESDVWQHIKLPSAYISAQHPIRYSVISSDARLIAVAGENGLTHYNAISGRWKLFELDKDEEAIRVVGGMAWWSNVLIVACIEDDLYQIRLFSRDRPLTLDASIESVALESEPLLISVIDSSLLVYTVDNTFHHFLIRQTGPATASIRLCGSIGFEGVVADPRAVRGISWLVPPSQQKLGDPADDLNVATVIFLIHGELVLLRPRKAASQEVKYDMQVLADRVEFYWTHLGGVGTLENSLWAYEGSNVRVWLDALTIEHTTKLNRSQYDLVEESRSIPLDFYPLAVLMDKGIIVGVNQEVTLRKTLDFVLFRIVTTTHLFIHHILRYYLEHNQSMQAVRFASNYQSLVYFAHSLEILLHAVLEDEADARPSRPPSVLGTDSRSASQSSLHAPPPAILPRVVDFLDHFDESLEVVVGCARKTELARWDMLFGAVGKPRDLFEKCMSAGLLKTAASYLLVLHNLESLEQSSKDTIRMLKAAMAAHDWDLSRELVRFLYSIDRSGQILRSALVEANALPTWYQAPVEDPLSPSAAFRRAVTSPQSFAQLQLGQDAQQTPTKGHHQNSMFDLGPPSLRSPPTDDYDEQTPKLPRVAPPPPRFTLNGHNSNDGGSNGIGERSAAYGLGFDMV